MSNSSMEQLPAVTALATSARLLVLALYIFVFWWWEGPHLEINRLKAFETCQQYLSFFGSLYSGSLAISSEVSKMRKTKLAAFLFMGLTPSFAQLGIAPQRENREDIVVNKYGVPVYYVSMGDSGSFGTLLPDGVYREQFRLRYLGDNYPGEDKYAGISIMLYLTRLLLRLLISSSNSSISIID